MIKKIVVTIFAICIVFGTLGYFNRVKIKEAILGVSKKNIPKAVSYSQAKKKIAVINGSVEMVEIIPVEANLKIPKKQKNKTIGYPVTDSKKISIPDVYNLDIPFSSQAPFAVWDEIHKDTCEETSVLMAARFILGKTIASASDADREILKIVDWQKRYFGFWKDTGAKKTADILKQYYGLKNVEVKYDIKLDDIKREIAQGHPVIVPAAGREFKNPFYTPPGPYYHMLVVKGYTKDKIITNDPGTKRGENFVYKNDIFYKAIHDWNSGDVMGGRKVMIVVKK